MSDTEEKEKKVYDHLFKILLAGDAMVGKSSLIKQYVDLTFRQDYRKTPSVDFAVKNLAVNRQRVKLHILDIPGEALKTQREKEKSLYQSVHGVVIVFDVANKQSFDNVIGYHDKAKDWCPEGFIFLFGNKNDLKEQRQVQKEDATALASKLGIEYFEVHAKDDTVLTDPFENICKTLLKSKSSGSREHAWWKKKLQTLLTENN